MTRAITLLLAIAALAVAGCGGDDNFSSSSSDTSSQSSSAPASSSSSSSGASTSAGASEDSGGEVEIKMQGFQFAPKTQTVKVGDTVKWTNEDTAAHNVKADSGATFKSSDFGQGGTYTYKATKAGTIQYECTLHPGMKATLTVQ